MLKFDKIIPLDRCLIARDQSSKVGWGRFLLKAFFNWDMHVSVFLEYSFKYWFKLVLEWWLKAPLLHCGFLLTDHANQNVRCKSAQFQIYTQNSSAGNQKYMPWSFLFSICVHVRNSGGGDGLRITIVIKHAKNLRGLKMKLKKMQPYL